MTIIRFYKAGPGTRFMTNKVILSVNYKLKSAKNNLVRKDLLKYNSEIREKIKEK